MPKKERFLISFIIFFISFSVLSIEVIYSKIFAVLTYYHFSSMIISIALLGFGAAGSYITLTYSKNTRSDSFIYANTLYFLISNIICFFLIIKLRFFPIKLLNDWTNQMSLLFYYLILSIPFFFAGKILSFVFTRYAKDIGSLYFWDLLGGGIGSFSVFIFLRYFSGPEIIHLISLILCFVLLIFILFYRRKKIWVLIPMMIILGMIIQDIHKNKKMLVHPPPSKEGFNWSPPWKGRGDIEYSKWDIIERLDITKSFRRGIWDFGGDISSTYRDQKMELRYMFKDGIASTGILRINQKISNYDFLKGYLQAAPYHIKRYNSVISIGFGGGIDLWIAAHHKLKKIIGVEINPLKVKILKHEYNEYSGRIAQKAILIPEDGRHYLSRIKSKIDVIQMSGLDSSPALASGAFAMSENYVFTQEAIKIMLNCLNPDGVISINRIIFDPPRESLRMVTTMAAAIAGQQESEIAPHFFIVRGNRWANILLKKSPFQPEEIENLKKWVREMNFRIIFNPLDHRIENTFSRFLRMDGQARKDFIRNYPYRINPSTDDAPFFFQYYKWKNLFREKTESWSYAIHMPVGLKIIIYSIIQITILGFLFIIVPLRKKSISFVPGISLNTIFYFASIGMGFILIEIILIQKFIVFLGNPMYSLSVILFTILVMSGIGSFVSKRIISLSPRIIPAIFGAIIGISLLYNFFLGSILNQMMGYTTVTRIIISIVILSPLSFLMGMPFPSGVRSLSKKYQPLIPWAWAVNSIFTVFGSVFCLFLSLSLGFKVSWLIALLFYVVAYISFQKIRRVTDND